MFIKYFTQSEELLYFSNDFSVIYSVFYYIAEKC